MSVTRLVALFLLFSSLGHAEEHSGLRIALNDFEIGKNTLLEIVGKNPKAVLSEKGDAGDYLASICFENSKQTWTFGASDMGGAAKEITQISISQSRAQAKDKCLSVESLPRLTVDGHEVKVDDESEIKKSFGSLKWKKKGSVVSGLLAEKATVPGSKGAFDKSTSVTIHLGKKNKVGHLQIAQILSQ